MSGAAAAPAITVGAQVELLPFGTSSTKNEGSSGSTDDDLAVAYGVSGIFEYAVTPYLSVGVSPRLVLNLKGKKTSDQADAQKEIDLRARIRGHMAVAPGAEVYAVVQPGYTIVTSNADGVDGPKGFAIGGAIGATYDVSPSLFVSAEAGYQRAFTSTKFTVLGISADADIDLSYAHVGLGVGTRF